MTAAPDDFWDRAIAEHDRPVFLSLLALGLLPDAARDIAQATWAELLAKQKSGQLPDIQLPGLAIRQARFLALNQLRRESTEKRVLQVVDASDTTADHAPDPLRTVLGREELDRATAELAKCSAQARRVFRLVYGRPPHTHAEVARQVGLSLQRVRQILCETRAKLRTALAHEGSPA